MTPVARKKSAGFVNPPAGGRVMIVPATKHPADDEGIMAIRPASFWCDCETGLRPANSPP